MKNYSIEVKELIEKPKLKQANNSNFLSWGTLLLAILTTFILFPESLDTVNEYYNLERKNESSISF